jgi:hypothetical protein
MQGKTIVRPQMKDWYVTFPFGTRLEIGVDLLNMSERFVIVRARTYAEAMETIRNRFGDANPHIHTEEQFPDTRRAFYPLGECLTLIRQSD